MCSSCIQSGSVEIATLPNQDPLEASTGLKPLLGIDVWEVRTAAYVYISNSHTDQISSQHAYYVDYRNVRPDYVKAIWDVIDWKTVEDRFVAAKK